MDGNKKHLDQDLDSELDIYDPQSEPDDDIPDLSTAYWQERFAKATVQRGRPKEPEPKVQTTIRLDADVVAAFKADGPGWQSRMNAALRKAAGV